ncbi:MAG: cbb3-type cytochrome c oxidase subunit I [Planctomycetota bacterium]|nr:cbb3-type cytochrome c oxidase subunit I [Planctomycetota bacterium]
MVRIPLRSAPAECRLLGYLLFLALAACALTVISGAVASIVYTDFEPQLRAAGLTLQHLRPIHETYAFAWVFLGGVSVVYYYLFREHGPFPGPMRLRMALQLALWTIAGIGILVTLLQGNFTGREYAGYHPAFSAMIMLGWLLFAWNFFARRGLSLRGQPVYVYMWSVGVVLFVVTYTEIHLYLLEAISLRPLRDLSIQWRGSGMLVGAFNQIAYGCLMYIVCCVRRDNSYAHSRTGFSLFYVGVLNSFTNYGHHTFHLPQSPWIHWISFLVSMLEVIILAKVFIDVLAMRRAERPAVDLVVADKFVRWAGIWTFLMLSLSLLISIPPINALIHGTHVVVAHSMGSMLGIDSFILWAGAAYIIRSMVGPDHPVVRGGRIRLAIPWVSVFLIFFWAAFLGSGVATGIGRYMDAAAPDLSFLLSSFPSHMFIAGFGLALAILWILGLWLLAIGSAIWRGGAAPLSEVEQPPPIEGRQ